MATEPDRGEWIDLSTPEGNARWDELVAADSREPQPLSSYADHRARRRNELALRPYDPASHRRT
jgi:hypothetical protein